MNIVKKFKEETGFSLRFLFPDKAEYQRVYHFLAGVTGKNVNDDAIKSLITERVRKSGNKNKSFSFSKFEKKMKENVK